MEVKETKVCPLCGSLTISRKARTHRENKRSHSYEPGDEGKQRLYYCKHCESTFQTPLITIPRPRQLQKNIRMPSFIKISIGGV